MLEILTQFIKETNTSQLLCAYSTFIPKQKIRDFILQHTL